MNKVLHQSRFLKSPTGDLIDLLGKEKRCPACTKQNPGAVIYDFGNFKIVKCKACGVLYLTPIPNIAILNQLYNVNYYRDDSQEHGYSDYDADKTQIVRSYLRRLYLLNKAIMAREKTSLKRIHEVGCAFGFGLSATKKVFSDAWVTGSDVSDEAVVETIAKGFDAEKCDPWGCSSAPEDGTAELLYLFDVIEHLPDIPIFREWAAKKLCAGGYLALTTPNMHNWLNMILGKRSPSIKIPQHIVYFSSITLERALCPEFSIEQQWVDAQYIGIGPLINRILHILNFSPIATIEKCRWSLMMPNGMELYLFKKNG